MSLRTTLSAAVIISLLSSCGSLVLGDTSTVEAQKDAIFACAKAEGDQIFPITTGVTLASGTVASVQIEPTDRVSPALAPKINACAAAKVAEAQAAGEVPTPTIDTVATDVIPAPAPAPVQTVALPAGCIAGGGVLQGASRYCVGATD